MAIEKVQISTVINANIEEVFEWFYHSENFIKSPIVFKSAWTTNSKWTVHSKRDIIMLAGRYFEEITEVEKNSFIRYRVNKSFPKVKQDFTEISFEAINNFSTRVTWTIEIQVPLPFARKFISCLAGKMATILYSTILKAGKKELEKL